MEMNFYSVTIYFKTVNFDSQTTFDVWAYSQGEAEDLALSEFTALGFEHVGKLIYHTDII